MCMCLFFVLWIVESHYTCFVLYLWLYICFRVPSVFVYYTHGICVLVFSGAPGDCVWSSMIWSEEGPEYWSGICFKCFCMCVHIYIYAFSRRFYPKRQCIQFVNVFVSMCIPWELNPQPFALLTQCSTAEPQEHLVHLCVSLTEKLDEMLSSPKEPVVVMRPRPADSDSRAATVKQRPTSRRFTQAEINVSLIHINVHI